MSSSAVITPTERKRMPGAPFAVLVTDGDYSQTLGIVRSLGRKGFRVSAVGGSAKSLAGRSRYCFETIVAPRSGDDGFSEAVLEILRGGAFDLLIPVGYKATEALASRREEIDELTRLELTDHQRIRFAADKQKTCELAARLGIPTPKAVYPLTFDDMAASKDRLRYPVIVKPVRESAGSTVRHASNPSELLRRYRECCEQWGRSGGALPMVQEFIPGYGCGFFGLYQHGVCKRVFMHRRIRENPPTGGASACAESFYDEKLKEYGLRILDELHWHGVAMVEFRYDLRTGDYTLLEINPKFWGSLDLALAAGVDFPFYLCQMAEGVDLRYSEEYRTNVRHHWPLSGEIGHIVKRPASLAAVLLDSLNPSVKSNVWMRDALPNLHESLGVARSAYRRMLGSRPV